MTKTMLTLRTLDRFEARNHVEQYNEKEINAIETAAYIGNLNASNHPGWTEEEIYNEFVRILGVDGIELYPIKDETRTEEEVVADIIEYFRANEDDFEQAIEDLDIWNGCLGDDRWYNMCDLSDLLSGKDVIDVLQMAFHGVFNPNHDYFRFNGYGNLVSSWQKDYSDHLDKWTIQEMSEHRNEVFVIEGRDELTKLFDELEIVSAAR